jgi:DNA-binding response OmpR family regulator
MATILIADDDNVMLKLYELHLKKAGHTLIICQEGSSVMEQFERHTIELAVLDYLLPGKTGLELIQIIRKDNEKLPLIVITAQGKQTLKQDLLNAGANAVFTKPFSPSVLMKTIESLL